MKLTQVLYTAPKFHYWKDFGAGKKKKISYYRNWWNQWRFRIARTEVVDHTIPADKLPPNSRIMDAEDFMRGHIDHLPEELLKNKNESIVYDHPWPFNAKLEEINNQELMYCYDVFTRFFVPGTDSLVLTNTLLETDNLKANPPFEPSEEQLEVMQRQYNWCTEGDSILSRLPKTRIFPFINKIPQVSYGPSKERIENHTLGCFYDYSQNLVAQYYNQEKEKDKLIELLDRRSISFPYCQVPLTRDGKKVNFSMCIDHLSISKSSLPVIDPNPQETTLEKEIIDIKPRSWKSLLEQSRRYKPEWSFTLPRNSYLNTMQLGSRIIRDYRDENEMFDRALIHSFGLTTQFSRLKCFEKQLSIKSSQSNLASVILENPLEVEAIGLHDRRDHLEQPIVLQTIGFDYGMKLFYFMRYQLNSTSFNGKVKNQVWFSGPVGDLKEVFRYYLDFQAFDQNRAKQSLLSEPRQVDTTEEN